MCFLLKEELQDKTSPNTKPQQYLFTYLKQRATVLKDETLYLIQLLKFSQPTVRFLELKKVTSDEHDT